MINPIEEKDNIKRISEGQINNSMLQNGIIGYFGPRAYMASERFELLTPRINDIRTFISFMFQGILLLQ